jgi:hypothetical protein
MDVNSAQKFSELFGLTIPPVQTPRDVPLQPANHGKKMNAKYAPFTAFGMPIQFIQDFDGGSPYTDFIAKHGEGLPASLQPSNGRCPSRTRHPPSEGAIRQAPARADIDEIVDLEPRLPFGFDIFQGSSSGTLNKPLPT